MYVVGLLNQIRRTSLLVLEVLLSALLQEGAHALVLVGGAAAGIVIAMKKKNAKAENVGNEEDKDNN